jgi:hypothetical protein
MHTTANVRVGRPDTSMTAPSHVRGVREGNQRRSLERQVGIHPMGMMAVGTARRSTGINAKHRNPIDSNSPNLSPA